MSQLFWRGKQRIGPASVCLCVCLLPHLLAVCNFSSGHDRGSKCTKCAVTKLCVCACTPLFPSCLCSRTSRRMLQRWSAISPACQVTSCTRCLRREQNKNTVPSLSMSSSPLFSFCFPFSDHRPFFLLKLTSLTKCHSSSSTFDRPQTRRVSPSV